MLIYTRTVAPKVPKKRSRAGCTFCKKKKKKCDEIRPSCRRCTESDLSCTYEAVKPRQRRKRDSQSGLAEMHQIYHRSMNDEEWQLPDETDDIDVYGASFFTDDLVTTPSSSGTFEYSAKDFDIQAQELLRRKSSLSVVSSRLSPPPVLAMIAPCPVPSPTLDFCIPAFSEFSERPHRRALVDHFCNVLSHLIVFREESGNPFQQLVLPLSFTSPPVMNAIYALASAHLEYRGVDTGEKSLHFHNEALQGLAQLIEKGGKVNHKNELLAAIMLLVYYEALVQRGHSNIVDGHLKGALTIMSSSDADSSPISIFLECAFRFYDVITALSLGTAPLASAPAAGCLIPFPPLDAPIASPLCNVDSLLGMATTLWPIMHRLSNLLSLKGDLENATRARQHSKIAVTRTEFEETSQAIEAALERWQPFLPPGVFAKDGVVKGVAGEEVPEQHLLQSILHNALAYRHSAFVYLYRTIYGYHPGHEAVQKHAHLALTHCAQTVAYRGPMGALLWPLFVAACEAMSSEDRALAEQAFVAVDIHQGMINIEKAWGVVQEVWKQLDLLSATPYGAKDCDLWRRVSKEMGVSIVFG